MVIGEKERELKEYNEKLLGERERVGTIGLD
jgi:hypothetical protein